VRVADRTVEALHKGDRVASHTKSPGRRSHITVADHMPSAHRRHASWTPARITAFAEKIGPATAALTEAIMTDRPHPEQGFRTCLGILSLEKVYGQARREARLSAGQSHQGPIRQFDPLDPQDRPRSRLPRSRARARTPAPRQHPGAELLPLTLIIRRPKCSLIPLTNG